MHRLKLRVVILSVIVDLVIVIRVEGTLTGHGQGVSNALEYWGRENDLPYFVHFAYLLESRLLDFIVDV